MQFVIHRLLLLFGSLLLVVSGTLAVLRQKPSEAFFLLTQERYFYTRGYISHLYQSNGNYVRQLSFVPLFVEWSVDGETVFFTDRQRLYKMSIFGRSKPTAILETTNDTTSVPFISQGDMSVSPQGDAYIVRDDFKVYWMAPDGNRIRPIWQSDVPVNMANWTPDGQSALVVVEDGSSFATYQVDIDRPDTVKKIANSDLYTNHTRFGDISRVGNGNYRLRAVDGTQIDLALPDDTYFVSAWIDPSTVVVTHRVNQGYLQHQVYLMDIVGHEMRLIFEVRGEGPNQLFTLWHPSSAELSIFYNHGEGSQQYVYDVAQGTLRDGLQDYLDLYFYDADRQVGNRWPLDGTDYLIYTQIRDEHVTYNKLNLNDGSQAVLYHTPGAAVREMIQAAPARGHFLLVYRDVRPFTDPAYRVVIVDVEDQREIAIQNQRLVGVSPLIDRPAHAGWLTILGTLLIGFNRFLIRHGRYS